MEVNTLNQRRFSVFHIRKALKVNELRGYADRTG